jgi:hypothetical protein
MATSTDVQAFVTAVAAFRDAWSNYNANDSDSQTALVGAAGALGSAVTNLVNENAYVAAGSNALGLASSLVSLSADVKAYDAAVSNGDTREQTSSALAIASDVAGAGAGASALLVPVTVGDPPVSGGLAVSAAVLTTISLGAQGAKTIYDAGNAIDDYLAKVGDEIMQNWIEEFNSYQDMMSSLVDTVISQAVADLPFVQALAAALNALGLPIFGGDPPPSPHYEPLVLNLTGGSALTMSLNAGVYFDYNNNGFEQATGWVALGQGILVYDPSGGNVTNGSELFGTSMQLADGTFAVNGFQALAQFDANGDGKIDSSDAVWSARGRDLQKAGEPKRHAFPRRISARRHVHSLAPWT